MAKFSQELFDAVCGEIANGKGLRAISKQDGMPNKSSVLRWIAADESGKLRDQYARAKEEQADEIFDECLTIADEASVEDVQQARLRIDTRKWMAGKLRPKKYGDKVVNEHSGPEGGGIPVAVKVTFGK